jgi:hypothetical protein
MPIILPLVKAMGKNLRGKAFRFGIFLVESSALGTSFALVWLCKIGRQRRLPVCGGTMRLARWLVCEPLPKMHVGLRRIGQPFMPSRGMI